jgi:hypothetical protein
LIFSWSAAVRYKSEQGRVSEHSTYSAASY